MSIVKQEKLKTRPETVLYHSPSMPALKFTKMFREYHYWRAVQAAEDAAAVFGCVLVPSKCLHWQRRELLQAKRVAIGRNTFYALELDQMTAAERRKLANEIEEAGHKTD